MTNKDYEIIEHTADVGIKAYGENPSDLFINAARGMFEIIADTRQIKPKEQLEIKQEAPNYEELLLEWLRELLYQYNKTAIIFTEFSIQELTPNVIKAIVWGDRNSANIKTEIKAVTYHNLEFKEINGGYEAKVIFDV